MLSCDFRRMVAVALVLTVTFVTMPLTAADFPATSPAIGSVSSVGSVELRGVGITQEENLFTGDNIRSLENATATVVLGAGSKLALAENTDVNVSSDKMGVKVAMSFGTMGFSAAKPLRIDVMPFEVTATDDASGNVIFKDSKTASIQAVSGKVLVRNLKTSESFVVAKGQEGFLKLTDGAHSVALAQWASTTPGPIPADPQAAAAATQAPAGKTHVKGLGMDKGAWLAVIGGIIVTGVATWALVQSVKNRDDIKDQRTILNGISH